MMTELPDVRIFGQFNLKKESHVPPMLDRGVRVASQFQVGIVFYACTLPLFCRIYSKLI